MTNVFSKKVLATGFTVFTAVSFSTAATFAAGTKPVASPAPAASLAVTSESAEICHSNDGRFISMRGFGDTTTALMMRNPDPAGKPIVKQGLTFTKDPAGSVQKNPVAPEMFELMAENFGATTKPKAQWKNTYEGRFDGVVSVSDDTGKKLGSITMSCHLAIVEY